MEEKEVSDPSIWPGELTDQPDVIINKRTKEGGERKQTTNRYSAMTQNLPCASIFSPCTGILFAQNCRAKGILPYDFVGARCSVNIVVCLFVLRKLKK